MTEWGQTQYCGHLGGYCLSAPVAGYEGHYTMRHLLLYVL